MPETANTAAIAPDNTPETVILEKAAALQQQLERHLQQLSLEQLQAVEDFVVDLLDRESEAATQELLEIPGLLETIQQQRATTPKEQLVNWRAIRSDV